MHGRSADELQAGIAKRPLPECVRLMAEAGFGGIYVDRNGYADHGAGIEASLAALLGRPPIVSPNQRLCFFDIGHSSKAPTQTRLRPGMAATVTMPGACIKAFCFT